MRFPDDVNGDVFRRMVASGFDFSVPHPVEFFAVFADGEAANRVARRYIGEHEAGEDTLAGVRTTPLESGETELFIARPMLVTHAAVTAYETRLGERVAQEGGRLDGWGVLQD